LNGDARTYLAFDYGTRQIGVAVARSFLRQAQALANLHCPSGQPDWDAIADLIREWQPTDLVVGLPLNMDETDNPVTVMARGFGEQLGHRYNLPVHMVDERLTSRAARHELKQAGVSASRIRRHGVDKYAAREILQTFLNDLG